MFQNIGEIIHHIGSGLVVLFVLGILGIRVLHYFGKITLTNKKGMVLGGILLLGIVCIFAGDAYRKNIAKDVMLSYYEKDISYNDLTPAQQKNITVAMISLPYEHKNGKDVARYLPSLEKYVAEFYLSLGQSEEAVQETMERYMKAFYE